MTQENPHELKFATKFPDWHPRKGEPTYFAASINFYLFRESKPIHEEEHRDRLFQFEALGRNPNRAAIKIHTARKGHIFKVGDWIQPITEDGTKICPPLRLTWVRDFVVNYYGMPILQIADKETVKEYLRAFPLRSNEHCKFAENDGLSIEDFTDWFSREPFDGQFIGWTADPYTNL